MFKVKGKRERRPDEARQYEPFVLFEAGPFKFRLIAEETATAMIKNGVQFVETVEIEEDE